MNFGKVINSLIHISLCLFTFLLALLVKTDFTFSNSELFSQKFWPYFIVTEIMAKEHKRGNNKVIKILDYTYILHLVLFLPCNVNFRNTLKVLFLLFITLT